MKYLITPHNLNNLNKLIAANGFVIGNSRFSARITNSFDEAEINQIIDFAQEEKKEIDQYKNSSCWLLIKKTED